MQNTSPLLNAQQNPNFAYGDRDVMMSQVNSYFATLLDPVNVGGIKIPDYGLIPTTTKRILTSDSISVPTSGTGTTPTIEIFFFPHNVEGQGVIFVTWPEQAINQRAFWRTITPTETLAAGYSKARTVSGALSVVSASVASGLASLQGTVDCVAYQDIWNLVTTLPNETLPFNQDNKSLVTNVPLSGGVIALAQPFATLDFSNIEGTTIQQNDVVFTPVSFPTTVFSTPLSLNTPDLIFGSIDVEFRTTVTLAAPAPTNINITLQPSVFQFNSTTNTASQNNLTAVNVVTIPQGFVGPFVITNTISFIANVVSNPINRFIIGASAFPGGIVIGGQLRVRNLEAFGETYIRNGIAMVIKNPAPSSVISLSGVVNYEVVPNSSLIKDLKVTVGQSYADPKDFKMAKRALARDGDPNIRMVYPLQTWKQLQAENYFMRISHREHLKQYAASGWGPMIKGVSSLMTLHPTTAPFAPLAYGFGEVVETLDGPRKKNPRMYYAGGDLPLVTVEQPKDDEFELTEEVAALLERIALDERTTVEELLRNSSKKDPDLKPCSPVESLYGIVDREASLHATRLECVERHAYLAGVENPELVPILLQLADGVFRGEAVQPSAVETPNSEIVYIHGVDPNPVFGNSGVVSDLNNAIAELMSQRDLKKLYEHAPIELFPFPRMYPKARNVGDILLRWLAQVSFNKKEAIARINPQGGLAGSEFGVMLAANPEIVCSHGIVKQDSYYRVDRMPLPITPIAAVLAGHFYVDAPIVTTTDQCFLGADIEIIGCNPKAVCYVTETIDGLIREARPVIWIGEQAFGLVNFDTDITILTMAADGTPLDVYIPRRPPLPPFVSSSASSSDESMDSATSDESDHEMMAAGTAVVDQYTIQYGDAEKAEVEMSTAQSNLGLIAAMKEPFGVAPRMENFLTGGSISLIGMGSASFPAVAKGAGAKGKVINVGVSRNPITPGPWIKVTVFPTMTPEDYATFYINRQFLDGSLAPGPFTLKESKRSSLLGIASALHLYGVDDQYVFIAAGEGVDVGGPSMSLAVYAAARALPKGPLFSGVINWDGSFANVDLVSEKLALAHAVERPMVIVGKFSDSPLQNEIDTETFLASAWSPKMNDIKEYGANGRFLYRANYMISVTNLSQLFLAAFSCAVSWSSSSRNLTPSIVSKEKMSGVSLLPKTGKAGGKGYEGWKGKKFLDTGLTNAEAEIKLDFYFSDYEGDLTDFNGELARRWSAANPSSTSLGYKRSALNAFYRKLDDELTKGLYATPEYEREVEASEVPSQAQLSKLSKAYARLSSNPLNPEQLAMFQPPLEQVTAWKRTYPKVVAAVLSGTQGSRMVITLPGQGNRTKMVALPKEPQRQPQARTTTTTTTTSMPQQVIVPEENFEFSSYDL